MYFSHSLNKMVNWKALNRRFWAFNPCFWYIYTINIKFIHEVLWHHDSILVWLDDWISDSSFYLTQFSKYCLYQKESLNLLPVQLNSFFWVIAILHSVIYLIIFYTITIRFWLPIHPVPFSICLPIQFSKHCYLKS